MANKISKLEDSEFEVDGKVYHVVRESMVDDWEFLHNGKSSVDDLIVRVNDLRDLIYAFCIRDEEQRMNEVNTILRAVERRNRMEAGSLTVRKNGGILNENTL